MCNIEEEEVLILAAMLDDEERSNRMRRKRRTVWVHQINQKRKEHGEFHKLYPELRKDEIRFFTYFRMNFESFDEILNLITDDITKEQTKFGETIEPIERLAVTLWFLATGDSYKTIGHSFRMGFSTVAGIIEEVCEAIWNNLQPIYMPEPTLELWEKSISGFKDFWQFPNCLGGIDGKHVTIKCPQKSGSNYFCYLKKFSIVLMAIVDPEYKFICIDVGGYGKNSDGGIFEASAMGRKFEQGTLNIPPDRPLPGGDEDVPCVLIGDEAFSLSPYLMRLFPYRQSRHDSNKELFNNYLCRARRVVENAFGILTHKWRLFFRPLEVNVDTAKKLVKAACVLHNLLRIKNIDQQFVQPQKNDANQDLIFNNMPVDGRRAVNVAFNIREKFVTHFNNF